MSAPNLTSARWEVLLYLKTHPHLMARPFLAREIRVAYRGGKHGPASGATMHSLREAGWLRHVVVGDKPGEMPFRTGGPAACWEITDTGREAVAACPDEYPGGFD
jgi:hypothetical protein